MTPRGPFGRVSGGRAPDGWERGVDFIVYQFYIFMANCKSN